MSHIVREVREETVEDDAIVENSRQTANSEHGTIVLARVIYFIGGVIMSLIAIRILLSLLGANQANAFADLIYTLSYPFVAPFFGLFNYTMKYGVSRLEFESIIALIVWGLITMALARLAVIGNRTVNQ